MSINEKTAKHTRRILKDSALTASEIANRLNHEVSAVDAYNISQIGGMLKQMPDVEEADGKYSLKTREDVNEAAARVVREATEH